MSFFPQPALPADFIPFSTLREHFGFVPNMFRAQTLLPRAIEVEAEIAGRVLLTNGALPRIRKESILLAVAGAKANTYCVALHSHFLGALGLSDRQVQQVASDASQAELPDSDRALLDFALKLSQRPVWISRADVEALHRHGFADEHVLEAVLVTALAEFLCTVTVGVGAEPDFPPYGSLRRRRPSWDAPGLTPSHHQAGPYVRTVEMTVESFAPFAFFRDRFGFIPSIFRAQTLRPDVVEAEAHAVAAILLSEDVLTRVRNEYILLVVSAANLNTYCVAVHCELLRGLGVSEDESDRIVGDHQHSGLSPADSALLDLALKLSQEPWAYGGSDIEGLRRHGFSDTQILEGVVMTALANFLNTVQMGLGPVPDFAPRRTFGEKATQMNLEPAGANLTARVPPEASPPGRPPQDPAEAAVVTRAQAGDVEAFGELVKRHHRRLYRTLLGITGNAEDAEEAVQNAMLKAFQHIRRFEGASRFSTWLTRIAINEALQGRRKRRPAVSVEAGDAADGEGFRPRQIQSWVESPEQLYSRLELRELIERELLKLPPKYRMALLLRDIQQLSAEEAAQVLGVEVANLKTRLHRGRLMLREALAPYLSGAETRRGSV